ncbi:MAG: hypothetical protein AAF438_12660, partial [Pseudomonadota bacterium]
KSVMKNRLIFLLLFFLGHSALAEQKLEPVTQQVWREAVISVTDLYETARFFREIGGYEVKWRGPLDESALNSWGLSKDARGEAMLLGPPDYTTGFVRLVRFDNAGPRQPMRPGSRAWDTGCYFSLMIRVKGMQKIYDDAIGMGWWTETPITDLSFGTSKLKVVIYKGPDGVQVQTYERLTPPLPEAIPPFERMAGPFNMMQMVRDRDVTYDFFTNVLGFDTFYLGKPYVSKEPVSMPLGIPINMTTTARYRAGIVFPVPGEFGRMEMIEMMDLKGHDFSDRCDAPNLGLLAVRYPVDDAQATATTIESRGGKVVRHNKDVSMEPYGRLNIVTTKSPDGGIVQFFDDAS